jgi:hypothetical protein
MNRILRQASHTPGLPKEYSQAFPRSGMKFRDTSKTLCCRVWLSQIWYNPCILHSTANFDKPPLIIICSHSQAHHWTIHFTLSKHIVFLPECFESVRASTHQESSFRHETFRCRRGSSCSSEANIWIYAWSVRQARRFNAINHTLHVNLSFEGKSPSDAYRGCTALINKFPHLTGFWVRRMFRPIHFPDPNIASVVRDP